MPLTVREHMALSVEAQRWRYLGAKETYLREHLGWSLVRHAQVVNLLIDRHDASAEYPTLTARLRRLRETRQSVRRKGSPSATSSEW